MLDIFNKGEERVLVGLCDFDGLRDLGLEVISVLCGWVGMSVVCDLLNGINIGSFKVDELYFVLIGCDINEFFLEEKLILG